MKMGGRLELQSIDKFRKCHFANALKNYYEKDNSFDIPHAFSIFNELITSSSTSITCSSMNCLFETVKNYTILEGQALDEDYSFFQLFHHLEQLLLKDKVFLDEDTLHSLKIFPSVEKTGHDKLIKDGCFSVFELLNHTTSELSKNLLKSWLVSPLAKKELIEKRYEIVRILTSEENCNIFEELCIAIKGVSDVFHIISSLKSGKTKFKNWYSLSNFLVKCVEIHRVVSEIHYQEYKPDAPNLLTLIKIDINPVVLDELYTMINSVIDLELSLELATIVIRDGINETLDEYRLTYNRLENVLCDTAKHAQTLIFEALSDENKRDFISKNSNDDLVNAVYIPQLGYLISVDATVELIVREAQSEWEEIFRTPTNLYFKNEKTMEMDEYYGDVYALISDLEIEILYSLKSEILAKKEALCSCAKYLAELEVLICFAKVKVTKSYVEPELLGEDCVLEIKNGRHPLYETLVDTYISNDTNILGNNFDNSEWFSQNSSRILVLTGANASGKSVFLTQNGLIVFLAHIGCFVPATSARIGIVDKILTRIRTGETVLKAQSTFLLDSQQMAKCLSLMTEKSLLLVDEFGKGTDVIDGPSLFGSIIMQLSRNPKCPRTIVCTHYHELFKADVLTDYVPGISHYRTEILLSMSAQSIGTKQPLMDNGITFLYRVREGIAKGSFGVHCAKICGLATNIVKRAETLADLIDQGQDVVEYCSKLTDEELVNFRQNQDIVKRFVSWDLDLELKLDSNVLQERLINILQNTNKP